MTGQGIDRNLLLRKDIHAELERRHGRVKLRAQEIGKRELAFGLADDHRTALVQMRNTLARHIVVGQDARAVGITLKALLVELREQLASRNIRAEELRRLAEKAHPCVHVVRAVVAVHHGDGLAAGRGDHIDLLIDLRQGLFQYDHSEDRRTCRDVAGSGCDGVRRRHAGACIAFGRAERDAGGQKPFKERSPDLRQLTCGLSGHQDLGQDAAGRPREAVFGQQRVEFFEHRRVIVQRFTVNGEHTGGFSHAEDVFAREQIVDIAGKRRDVRDIFDVRFAVQNGLIQMRNGPALWDVEAEFCRKLLGGLAGHGVLPGAERCQQVPVLVEGQIAVHHAGNAHGRNSSRQLAEVADGGAQAILHILHVIRPDAVFQTAFPCVVTALDDAVLAVDQDGLDARGTEFNSKIILFHSNLLDRRFWIFCFYHNSICLFCLADWGKTALAFWRRLALYWRKQRIGAVKGDTICC